MAKTVQVYITQQILLHILPDTLQLLRRNNTELRRRCMICIGLRLVYTYIYTYTYIHTYIYMHISTHVHAYLYIYLYMVILFSIQFIMIMHVVFHLSRIKRKSAFEHAKRAGSNNPAHTQSIIQVVALNSYIP